MESLQVCRQSNSSHFKRLYNTVTLTKYHILISGDLTKLFKGKSVVIMYSDDFSYISIWPVNNSEKYKRTYKFTEAYKKSHLSRIGCYHFTQLFLRAGIQLGRYTPVRIGNGLIIKTRRNLCVSLYGPL